MITSETAAAADPLRHTSVRPVFGRRDEPTPPSLRPRGPKSIVRAPQRTMNDVAADDRRAGGERLHEESAEGASANSESAVNPTPVEDTEVVVIGAGQAGLSAAFHLQRSGMRHIVLDAESGPGGAWQHRWPTLTMATVNGIRELPGSVVPPVDPSTPARAAIPEYFAGYESQFGLQVRRPVQVSRVESVGDMLMTTARDGTMIRSSGLINATGTWTRPFWPHYPGAADFRGRQLHTHDYRGPVGFDGARVVVIGGGISAVQLLMELASHTAEQTWVTRRPPVWVDREFTPELGRAAVAMVIDRVSRGLPPRSVVSVTGLGLTPATIAARASGVLQREEMFQAITADGVRWADGRTRRADILFWCTGFRAALDHLGPLHLRGPGGGIVMDGTAVAADRRIHLVGYGPSASTIGANRAGRLAVRDLRRLLHP